MRQCIVTVSIIVTKNENCLYIYKQQSKIKNGQRTIYRCGKKDNKVRKPEHIYESGIFCFIVSFLIPFTIMLAAFAVYSIHPFGKNQMLVVDLWHQYYPFFRVVREKLLTGGSFFYSWENGLGTNFLSLISYYAASPLNWISVFFSDAHVRDALMFCLLQK